MKIHEYQARELLKSYGVPVPDAEVARTPQQAYDIAEKWGGAVVKAQVLTGGRGKAGGVSVVSSADEARDAAERILSMSIKGYPVQRVLVATRLDIAGEYYAAITVDRDAKAIILIISAAGGMDIEEIAATSPEKILRFTMLGDKGRYDQGDLSAWLSRTFADESLVGQALSMVENMYRLFREKDCSLVEVNPLAMTADGRLIAADAKMVFDDNGLPTHSDIAELSNPEEYTPEELQAHQAGLSFVSLEGEIGCMVNGAGLAMATMDGINLAGGTAANFLDVGGSSDPQKVVNAMQILLKNEKLKVILINIFGGITRCDDVAQGLLTARDTLGITVPMVIRLIGTNGQQGRKMLRDAGITAVESMTEAVTSAVRLAAGEGLS